MSLQIPTDYNAEGLAPVVYIYDQNLQLRYTYQHPQIIDPPTQEFVLLKWQISAGINSNAGSCRLTIEDHDAVMTEGGTSIIRPGWHVQILLGKDAAGLESWYFGIINEPAIDRPGYGQQLIQISSYGYGHTLSTRFVTLMHEQERDANGDLDNTDMSACVSELVKQVFADESLVIPPPDSNLTLDGIDAIDVKLASLDKVNQSQGIVISELANVVNAVYGVDPNLSFFFHGADQHGGFTVSNGDARNIDAARLMIMSNKPYTTKDTIVRKAFTSLIGLDVTEQLDLINNPGGATTQRLARDEWYGWDIPYRAALPSGDIEIALSKGQSGEPGDLKYVVFEGQNPTDLAELDTLLDSGSGTGIAYSGSIAGSELTDLTTGINYVSFPVRLNAAVPAGHVRVIFMLIEWPERAMAVNRNDGPDQQYLASQSPGGVSNPTSGQAQMRVRSREQILLKAQNLTTQRQQQPKEQVQYLPDTPPGEAATRIFEGLLDQAGQIRRIFTGVTVSTPNERPPMGKRVRLIDTHNNLDVNPLLIGMDIGADRQTKLSAIRMTLELEQYV